MLTFSSEIQLYLSGFLFHLSLFCKFSCWMSFAYGTNWSGSQKYEGQNPDEKLMNLATISGQDLYEVGTKTLIYTTWWDKIWRGKKLQICKEWQNSGKCSKTVSCWNSGDHWPLSQRTKLINNYNCHKVRDRDLSKCRISCYNIKRRGLDWNLWLEVFTW